MIEERWEHPHTSADAELPAREQRFDTRAHSRDSLCQQTPTEVTPTVSQNVEKRDFRIKRWRKNREIARKMAQEETKMMQEQLALNSGRDELYVRTKPQQNSNDQVWAQVDHRQPGESGQPAGNRLESPFGDAKNSTPHSAAAIEEKPQGSPQGLGSNGNREMEKPNNRSNEKKFLVGIQGHGTQCSPTISGQRVGHAGSDVAIAQNLLPKEFDKIRLDDMEEVVGWDWEDVAGETEENGWTLL